MGRKLVMLSQAVELQTLEHGIALVKMQDKVNKNTFSPALTEGLIHAFKTINTHPEYKVVIITGYESYFSSGGSLDGLLYLSEGKGDFSERDLYSLSLNCPIPVIAAMQGHGIGGGFVMGLFADFVILTQESVYTTNFMKYGFTPGMGATLILPAKLGLSLAEEMMFSAKTYRGRDLQHRGVPFPVVPREEAMEYALELATTIADKPRVSLVTLKDHLVADLRERLPGAIEKELIMHEKTFHQPEVRDRIQRLFGT